jgi:hypothetical protein
MKVPGMLSRSVGAYFVTCIVLFSTLGASGGQTIPDDNCAAIRNALKEIGELKSGDSRAQLERSFELDGGLQVSRDSRYVFKKCQYIKVQVEFSTSGNETASLLPTDKIVKISRLYLENPVYD